MMADLLSYINYVIYLLNSQLYYNYVAMQGNTSHVIIWLKTVATPTNQTIYQKCLILYVSPISYMVYI